MHQFRYFQIEQHDGGVIVATIADSQLHGETMAELFRLEFLDITEKMSPKVVILDFSNVKIISSAIVSCLLLIRQTLRGFGIPLKLATMSQSLESIFRTLHLDGTFTIYQSTDQALNSVI